MRAATPNKKATEAFHSDLPDEDAWFDPFNLLQKERINEEAEGKQRQTESWHSFGTFWRFIASEMGRWVESVLRSAADELSKPYGGDFPDPRRALIALGWCDVSEHREGRA
jgi:hypothetical protein